MRIERWICFSLPTDAARSMCSPEGKKWKGTSPDAGVNEYQTTSPDSGGSVAIKITYIED